MRFMVIVPANQKTEAGVLPTEQDFAEMGKFNKELVDAGMMLAGEGLHPTAKGARITFTGKDTKVAKGPFDLVDGTIGGFWLIQAKSLDDAIEWMRKAPFEEGVTLEIRRVYENEDFGEALTPELLEQEERLRAQTAARNAR